MLSQLAIQTKTDDDEDIHVVRQVLKLKLKGPLYNLWVDALATLLCNNRLIIPSTLESFLAFHKDLITMGFEQLETIPQSRYVTLLSMNSFLAKL